MSQLGKSQKRDLITGNMRVRQIELTVTTSSSSSSSNRESVPLHIPRDIWQPLVEIRAQLDASCPGAPTPIEEALREIIIHYEGCSHTQDEIEAFCKRARAWKGGGESSRKK